MELHTVWSLAASIVSVLLGVFAIVLSAYFFVSGRNSEKAVSNSLTKIETQADVLQKITGRQMDRLTRYVTERREPAADPQLDRLVDTLLQFAQPLLVSVQQTATTDETVIQEMISLYIAVYFYTAQTNYWAQLLLPDPDEFNEDEPLHVRSKNVVDQSAADFASMANVLAKVDRTRLTSSPHAHLLQGAMQDIVKGSADIWLARREES